MGKLSDNLDEFQEKVQKAYAKIMKILEDDYCWKCPMRSTSTKSRCREVHAGRVLQEAVDGGIWGQLISNEVSQLEVEALIIRMLKKKIKRQGGKQKEKIIIMKVDGDETPDVPPGTLLMVKINPKRVRKGEKVLVPFEDLSSPVLGSYALVAGFPFHITEVERFFHEGNFWYLQVENERILPLESVFGVLLKVLKDDYPFCLN